MFVIMISFILTAGRTSELDIEKGSFSRAVEAGEIMEGDRLSIRYSVLFPDSKPKLVEMVQELPPGLGRQAVQETRLVFGRTEFLCRLEAPSRGKYVLQPCIIRISDLAGLTVHVHSFGGETAFEVVSRLTRLDMETVQPVNPRTLSGSSISIFKGGGSEFYSIRSYVEGESIRRVNWRASAKAGDLLVNEFLAESSGIQILVVDARLIENDAELSRKIADKAIGAATSIAYSSLNERNAVGIFVISEISTVIRPDYGIRQFMRIGEVLKRVGVPRYRSPANIHRMVNIYGDPKAQYIVISPVADEDTLDSIAELGRSREDLLTLVPLVDAPSRASSAMEMAMKLTRLRQETNALVISGVCRTVSWNNTAELSASLGRARKLGSGRRR